MLKLEVIKKLLNKDTKERPILQCIKYDQEYITFTDGYFLIRITNNEKEFTPETPILLNVFTGQLEGGTYPSVNNLIDKLPLAAASEPFEPILEVISDKIYYQVNDILFEKKHIETVLKSISLKLDDRILKSFIYSNGKLFIKNDSIVILIMGVKKQ